MTLDATIIEKHIQPTIKSRRLQNEILELDVFQITPQQTQQPHAVSFKLQCSLPKPTKFQVGDHLTIKNIIIKPPYMQTLSKNPSFGDYLIKEGFLGSIFLSYKKQPLLVSRPAWSINRWFWNLRNTTYQSIMRQLSPQSACYFSLIFLGKKDPEFTDDLRRTFNYWGLSHYLARSGIHIILFILIWQFFLGLLPIHLTYKRILLILICGTYGILSWASTPFIRAYYSFLIIESGKIKNFQPNYFHLLTLMCIVMLLFNPKQLFSLDFQLTFGLTFALVWLAQHQYAQQK
jgi:competence protein ComEC